MSQLSKETVKKFLHELNLLSNKFGITIDGCGCCGSPFLSKTKSEKYGHYNCDSVDFDYLTWTNADEED